MPPSSIPQSEIRSPQSAFVVVLGTGTPNADPDRSGPAVAIVVDEVAYLIDCGPGVVRRAAAAQRKGIEALAPEKLSRLFMTHLHSDHTVGYPDVIFTPWVLERAEPLEVYGPPGTRRMTEHLLAAYAADIQQRLDGWQPANPTGYQVNVHEIDDPSRTPHGSGGPDLPRPSSDHKGVSAPSRAPHASGGAESHSVLSPQSSALIYRDERLIVHAIPVHHGSWDHAYAFRFETPDRVIVVSGDTAPCAALVEAARGCDVLVHEVYSQKQFEKRPPEWQRYHKAFHTSTRELADIADQVKPGLLVLYHQLFWGASDEDLVKEIRAAGYKGKVVSARDLDVYEASRRV